MQPDKIEHTVDILKIRSVDIDRERWTWKCVWVHT